MSEPLTPHGESPTVSDMEQTPSTEGNKRMIVTRYASVEAVQAKFRELGVTHRSMAESSTTKAKRGNHMATALTYERAADMLDDIDPSMARKSLTFAHAYGKVERALALAREALSDLDELHDSHDRSAALHDAIESMEKVV